MKPILEVQKGQACQVLVNCGCKNPKAPIRFRTCEVLEVVPPYVRVAVWFQDRHGNRECVSWLVYREDFTKEGEELVAEISCLRL